MKVYILERCYYNGSAFCTMKVGVFDSMKKANDKLYALQISRSNELFEIEEMEVE